MAFKTNLYILCILAIVVVVVLTCKALFWSLHYFTVPVGYHGPPHPRGDEAPYPGSTPDNLWWFVQISDIHLTSVDDPVKSMRIRDFRQFCNEHLKTIQPTMVLLTGDITDGDPDSSENKGDWLMYQKILAEAALPYSLLWLDVRGNHDNFNIPEEKHPSNLFRNYSVMRGTGDSSFLFKLSLPFGTYIFIYIDALLKIGLKRPFNFFGILDEMDIFRLRGLSETAQQLSTNHTIYFGHYPTSTMLAPAGLSDVLRNGTAYLCGHLHDLDQDPGVKRMYTVQRHGSLELELEDWRKHRKYRIMAFDHDLLSFVDVAFGEWPVVLITNPKSAQFIVPGHEPVHKMLHSSHIRMLVFSPDPIKYIKVEVDQWSLGMAKAVDGGPLFILPWKPSKYSKGLHVITVKVRDAAGRVSIVSHKFSLDESRPKQPFWSSFILMVNGSLFFLCGVIFMVCVCILPLMFFRRYAEKPHPGITSFPLLYGLLLAVHTNDIYFSLLAIALYPLIGPWLIGEVLENSYGVVTMYGIYVNNTLIGDKFAMYFFIKDLMLFHVPLTLFCILHLSRAHALQTKQRSNAARTSSRVGDAIRVVISLFLLKPMLGQWMKRMSAMNHWYGPMALLISPKYSWTFLVGIYLGCRCVYMGFRLRQKEATNGEEDTKIPLK